MLCQVLPSVLLKIGILAFVAKKKKRKKGKKMLKEEREETKKTQRRLDLGPFW